MDFKCYEIIVHVDFSKNLDDEFARTSTVSGYYRNYWINTFNIEKAKRILESELTLKSYNYNIDSISEKRLDELPQNIKAFYKNEECIWHLSGRIFYE